MVTSAEAKKIALIQMQNLAKKKGGTCLSTKYENSNTTLLWQCSKKHKPWFTTPGHVKQGSWCPECAGQKRYDITDMQKLAKKNGGFCRSKKYVNEHTKLKWQCKKGHSWKTIPSIVIGGGWCPRCRIIQRGLKHRLTLKQINERVSKREIACLSDKYNGGKKNLKWQCKVCGNIWESIAAYVINGSGCPSCAVSKRGNYNRLTLTKVRAFGLQRDLILISDKYKNSQQNLEWKCPNGHTFKSNYNNLHSGKGCPECSSGVSERLCRKIFEELFQLKFPRKRNFPWLLNSKDNYMELDGYCREKNLAFEYQGQQHYEPNRFFQNKEDVNRRKKDDIKKLKLCKEQGITLLQIRYDIPYDKIQLEIEKACKKKGIDGVNFGKSINYTKLKGVFFPETLNEMKQIAKERDGKCLSEIYVNAFKPLRWQCNKDSYIWESPAMSVKNQGSWCPRCAKNLPLTIEKLTEKALEKGIEIIPKTIKNQRTKLKIKCKAGHFRTMLASSIMSGKGCRKCFFEKMAVERRQKTYAKVKSIVEAKGGTMISKSYDIGYQKLKIKCNNSHRFELKPNTIISRGQWCKTCSKQRLLNSKK